MANKDNLIKMVAQKLGPEKLQQMVDQSVQALGQDPDVTPEVIGQMINLFSQVAENPDSYQSVIQEAIQAGVLDQGDFPEQFDPIFIAIFLLALQGLQQRSGQGFARGGLSQAAQKVQAQGRDSDTILAHISPHEAAFLKRLGGSGTINPQTGLMEFGLFKKIKKAVKSVVKAVVPIAKAVLPIAVSMIPGIGMPLAAALSGLGTAALGGSLKESLLAGFGGALGTAKGVGFAGNIGQTLNESIPGLSTLGLSNQVLGAGVLGGATSGIAGKNILTGALTSGLTSYAAPKIAESINAGIPGSESVTADMIKGANLSAQMGSNPLVGAGTAGLISVGGNLLNDGTFLGPQAALDSAGNKLPPLLGDTPAPSDMVTLDDGTTVQYQDMVPGSNYELATTPVIAGSVGPVAPTTTAPPAAAGALSQVAQASGTKTGFSMGDIAKIGILGALIGGKTPQQANDAIQQDPTLTAQQKEGMLRQLTNYKFDPGMTVFPQQGTSEWDRLMGQINQGVEQTYAKPTFTEEPALARGGRPKRKPQGALSQISRVSQGAGDGRSDSIEARLSDGEYVIDAETVALLGNGSTKAGAAMLDQMRQQIRQQKGKALAKGKFSPDAKAPLAYMKGGLR